MQKNRVISIFGDSILKGVRMLAGTTRYGTTDDIGLESIAKSHDWILDNRSRFGCTIQKGELLLNRQLEKGETPAAVLLEYGGNDADFRWAEVAARPDDEHEPNTPLPVFVETLRRMIKTLRSRGVKPVLTTLPPISSERYLDWITRDGLSKENILHWLGDANAIYRYQEKYSLAIERLSAETGCYLVDLRSAFLEKRALLPYLCADGIHPNDAGQRLIHEVLSRAADRIPARV
ncbi:MAG: SGNH/GDSL hydrolase family protein [Clostridia bacterium]|nr:SGNH/GDSL hydrolase family protein [Clostridia bacterium]